MRTIAYNATLFHNNRGITGVAMCDATGHVFFRDDATVSWRELTDADAPALHLHGRVDLALAAAIADGDLVMKASRTLERRAA